MKKIISVLIMLACLFTFIACNNDETPDDDKQVSVSLSDFVSAIENTKPSIAVIDATVTTDLGDLTSKYTVTYNEDGSATIAYTYEKFNSLDQGAAEDEKTTYSGTVTRAADGTYSGDDNAPDLSGITNGTSIKLSELGEDDYTVTDGDTLTATVAADKTEAVLGTKVSKEVTLKVCIDGGAVEYVEISYEGATVKSTYN